MQVNENKFIIMLRDKSAYERFLTDDGYLSPFVKDVICFNGKKWGEGALFTMDKSELFEVRPLKITYEFDEN